METQVVSRPKVKTKYQFVGTPLEKIPQLKGVTRTLSALGYVSLEQLIYGTQVGGHELSSLLNVDLDQLISSVPVAAMTIPAAELDLISTADYALGFAIESLGPPLVAPDLSLPPEGGLTPDMNLIPQMPPIRDQQNRGTCVAHASVAALEHYLGRKGAYQDMSEQFCYWDAKQNDGHRDSPGTWLRVAMPLLQRDGCCQEATWKYNPTPVPGNEGQGPPPGGAQAEALQYRLRTVPRSLAPTAVADIKSELGQGRVVPFSIPVYNTWYRSKWVAYTGDLVLPAPYEVRVGGHAMCLVGYIDLPDKPEWGGGRFLLRNSWGTRWGIACPYGQGYGTIPYSYIARFGMEAYSIP